MNTTMVTPRKPSFPPGTCSMMVTSWRENPDWVSAQAIAVAVPMISRIAPDSEAVSTSIG